MFDIKDPTAKKDPAGKAYVTKSKRKLGFAFRIVQLCFAESHSYCTSETADGGLSGSSLIETTKTIQNMAVMISCVIIKFENIYRNSVLSVSSSTFKNQDPVIV